MTAIDLSSFAGLTAVEGCFLLVVAAIVWRIRYGKEKQRWQRKHPARAVS
ncbi:MAG: hypothetical protein ABSH49_21730 [Bryobacteraceae bacterium]|jgi:hypothetical protein